MIQADDPEFAIAREGFRPFPGERSVIVADITSASTSCGWAVPFLEYKAERTRLRDEYAAVGEPELAIYRSQFNSRSIDNLPALDP